MNEPDTDDDAFAHTPMPKALSDALREFSPQLFITGPALIRQSDSPTGWIVVIPRGG